MSDSNILWISGNDGTGKTAIASSVVAILNSTEFGDVIPNAHFFLSEDVDDDPRSVWRTIAFRLALSSPAYREFLSKSGVLSTDTKDLNANDLFDALIQTPLSRLNVLIVVVIDALDECHYRRRQDFLKTVADWKSLPSSCRLIVTSLNDNDIAREFDGTYHIDLDSRDESKETMVDIWTLFVGAFKKVEREGWPEDGEIHELVEYANRSFLWAATVVAFVVDGRGGDPRSRFDDVLRAFKDYHGDIHELLCAHILMHAHLHLETDEERESMFLILAFLTFQKAPLSRRELGELLMRDISIILNNLSPILKIGAPDEVVEFIHWYYEVVVRNLGDFRPSGYSKSFVQHLTRSNQTLRLTHACLRCMKKSLGAQTDKDSNSTAQRCSVITIHAEDGDPANVSKALKYASSYWVDHMNDIGRFE
ncbi:hypothetical protein SCHPADRAFT_999538 [Schizopora paradoxa]|uniref:Nephrocystin 3-like N-terminal domain-containing protein n=1 Tax=Schizopora paradoxa TaxID=27342 RepID=A0A0H2RFB4_9AGAM|nr:hypothetical protein SCHPADRAFT_999538 [Schizopora paradoxa]